MIPLLEHGPPDGPLLLLAHGAGAPMDSAFMTSLAAQLAGHGIRVVRFEFAYMRKRRTGGGRAPPPRADRLVEEFREILALQDRQAFVGGKSMGGRVASMLAADNELDGRALGLVCFGYPFHPPGKPLQLRTAHLEHLGCPALIVQGERDPFGTRQEVLGYGLPANIRLHWCPDGNHDLAPRKASGFTLHDNLHTACTTVARFMRACG